MKYLKESIFLSAIRSFFNTLLGTAGIFLAFIPIVLMITFFSHSTEDFAKTKIEILPNHKGNMKMLSMNTPAILQVNISGVIGADFAVKASEVKMQLLESRKGILKNNRVKAILLYINSPGGTVIDADNIYRNILAYKDKFKVPVYAYVDGLCASGGMYIACSADKIYSSPVGLIGSVGVKMGPFFNFYDLMDKYGVKSETLTQGKDKDALNSFRKWKKDEDQFFQDINAYYYNMFVNIVSKARNMDRNTLINTYGAHVFDPVKAKEYKYIDEINMSLDETLVDLLKSANIDPEKPYQYLTLVSKRTWLSPITGKAMSFFRNTLKSAFISNSENYECYAN